MPAVTSQVCSRCQLSFFSASGQTTCINCRKVTSELEAKQTLQGQRRRAAAAAVEAGGANAEVACAAQASAAHGTCDTAVAAARAECMAVNAAATAAATLTLWIAAVRGQATEAETLAGVLAAPALAPAPAAPAVRERPQEHHCPISMELMSDPVIAMDGNTYERAAIAAWFAAHDTSPMTQAQIPNTLIPNQAVRNMIKGWRP